MREGDVFILCVCVCLSVCLSVRGLQLLSALTKNLPLDHIWVKFEYQGHWVKVKVTLENDLFGLLDIKFICYDQLMVLKWSLRSRPSQGQGHFKDTVNFGLSRVSAIISAIRKYKHASSRMI